MSLFLIIIIRLITWIIRNSSVIIGACRLLAVTPIIYIVIPSNLWTLRIDRWHVFTIKMIITRVLWCMLSRMYRHAWRNHSILGLLKFAIWIKSSYKIYICMSNIRIIVTNLIWLSFTQINLRIMQLYRRGYDVGCIVTATITTIYPKVLDQTSVQNTFKLGIVTWVSVSNVAWTTVIRIIKIDFT